MLSASAAAGFRANEERQAEALRSAVDAWNLRHGGGKASLLDLTTGLGQALHAHARSADLTIFGKPRGKPSVDDREALMVALFELKRPVLLIPPDWQRGIGSMICIAWNASPQAERAVQVSVPQLQRAKAVTVLAGRGEEEPDTGSAEAVLQPIRIQAAMRPFSVNYAPVGATLLKLARHQDADLLVMGAYSHSPVTEAVLGGVTRDILAHAGLPVLTVH
jgi:nucleotide-binding universal stress UspA family protein